MAESQLPQHVGFILDGNRRWARDQGLPTFEGHKKGYGNLKDIGRHAINRGVKYVSAYIFSTENWQRDKDEVAYLMDLALWVAKNEVKAMKKDGIRVRFIGSPEGISDKLLKAIKQAEEATKDCTNGTLALCFNYGGKQEIVAAAQAVVASGEPITLATLNDNLYAPDIPPLDLIIRTSGEQRISNFMLWRAAYAELYFTPVHWPAFTTDDFDEALKEYENRQRRFGK